MILRRFKFNPRLERNFFQTAAKKYSGSFSFYSRLNNSGLKIAVVVPKKTAPKATDRNKIKRQIFNAILPTLEENQHLKFSIVIVVNKPIDSNQSAWKKELESLFSQLAKT